MDIDLDFQDYTYFNFDGEQIIKEIDTDSFAGVEQDSLNE